MKIGRRLQGLGAVAVKNSVYVLPRGDQALEDFQWVRREILAGGGEASVCEARFVDGLTDAELEALFTRRATPTTPRSPRRRARLQAGARRGAGSAATASRAGARPRSLRLRKRLAEVAAHRLLRRRGPRGRRGAAGRGRARLRPPPRDGRRRAAASAADVRGPHLGDAAGVHVDRIASAWLIRRFIDPEARSSSSRGQEYAPAAGRAALRHVRGASSRTRATAARSRCCCAASGSRTRRSRRSREIVHDIDLKDAKFARPEAAGSTA